MRSRSESLLAPPTLEIAGIEILVRRNPRARRMWLRFDPARTGFVLTLPARMALFEGKRFALGHEAWMRQRLASAQARIPFVDGALIPVLGEAHQIRHAPANRKPVERRDGALIVSGEAAHLARRVGDYLRSEARRLLADEAAAIAARLDRKITRLRISDPRSRWGSCNARGVVCFSWRLVMMPETVRRYVVVHEAAHLVELNHGPRFWELVETVMPNWAEQRAWLKREGPTFHRYGSRD